MKRPLKIDCRVLSSTWKQENFTLNKKIPCIHLRKNSAQIFTLQLFTYVLLEIKGLWRVLQWPLPHLLVLLPCLSQSNRPWKGYKCIPCGESPGHTCLSCWHRDRTCVGLSTFFYPSSVFLLLSFCQLDASSLASVKSRNQDMVWDGKVTERKGQGKQATS